MGRNDLCTQKKERLSVDRWRNSGERDKCTGDKKRKRVIARERERVEREKDCEPTTKETSVELIVPQLDDLRPKNS